MRDGERKTLWKVGEDKKEEEGEDEGGERHINVENRGQRMGVINWQSSFSDLMAGVPAFASSLIRKCFLSHSPPPHDRSACRLEVM